jgi:ligand-binding SRPBCC domain-containing protein
MPVYALNTSTKVPLDAPRLFAFFGDARNLDRLTPPWLHFRIRDETTDSLMMRPGTRIDYRLRLYGVPISWQTEITVWDPSQQFVDEQRRGPYHWWIHTHTFTPIDGGTEMEDEVRYCPRGGALPHLLFVRRQLRRIFQFRHRALYAALGLPAPRDRVPVRIVRAW